MVRGSVWTPHTELPRPDYWLIDPSKEKFETPVDMLGIVDWRELARLAFLTLDPEYVPSFLPNRHHLQWPKTSYPKKTIARQFREIPCHSIELSRDIHGWVHQITLPPPIPDEEVMLGRVKTYDAARELFVACRNVVRLQREKDRLLGRLPNPGLRGTVRSRQKGIAENRRHFEEMLKEFVSVPQEVRIAQIDPNQNMKKIAERLALIALKPQPSFGAVLRAA